ncbi:TRAP transporter small permease [Hydrogenophaga sp.]
MFLSCLSMVATFCAVLLGVVSRQAQWDIAGLDAYAGYFIACALFLALPATLRQGEHIRVTLLLDRVPGWARGVLEGAGLVIGLCIALSMAWYAIRLVWVSWITHDISPGADVTPLWIPQIGMALGCIGFALSFAHALLLRHRGEHFTPVGGDAARTE